MSVTQRRFAMLPWRVMSQLATGWARTSNGRAIDNARAAAVECSRRAVERADVRLFLEESHRATAYAAAE